MHRIGWWAMAGNTGSSAVVEKLGFIVEGALRNRRRWDPGRRHSA
ncbi:hypothetical protein ACFXPV_38660 [Streptomyces sp. NPDC059118]